jgi:hypothetical protein
MSDALAGIDAETTAIGKRRQSGDDGNRRPLSGVEQVVDLSAR